MPLLTRSPCHARLPSNTQFTARHVHHDSRRSTTAYSQLPSNEADQNPRSPPDTPIIDPASIARTGWYERAYAYLMATGMAKYETAMSPVKERLFAQLAAGFAARAQDELAEPFCVLEIGIGTGPNLRYLCRALASNPLDSPAGPTPVQHGDSFMAAMQQAPVLVRGIDPNSAMFPYTKEAAAAAGLGPEQVQLVVADAARMPFPDASCDAAVMTLVLCSVRDHGPVLQEVRRVLRPGGQLLFIEHVQASMDDRWIAVQQTLRVLRPGGQLLFIEHVQASMDDRWIAVQQTLLNPLHKWAAGCSLKCDTQASIRAAGFTNIQLETGHAPGIEGAISPHIWGLATK
eukprot:CAMPEP_0119116408 /NCGR_PEP_ID=MMETSP1180-20130426/52265_1 /TAXON_ID=3052 ORGANISM="Chlamydomonas cf sp, Strain CCMP681" /NCGR_SAMPLE_ID=MMETSP1180 /ASSEMBLY_ACC=CAM_ASM_000741 /LENGTH=344 /DNA_ID=CAMNT_0007105551 /DNA_START=81 /DNA_END=1115 /DNA_ORIENTATION=+